jgi:hypothetical protein
MGIGVIMNIEYGFCHCGCGNKTNIAYRNFKKFGIIKGEPTKFLLGHNARIYNPSYVDGKMHPNGYIYIKSIGHARCNSKGYVPEHILIAERVLGKSLPNGSLVHHVNRVRSDNRNKNLVVCQDIAYHHLIHMRDRAFKSSGHANWRICNFCKKYDYPENLHITPKINNSMLAYHNLCRIKYHQDRKKLYENKS